MKPCLICNQEDNGLKNKYMPGRNVDFVCSRCVTIYIGTEQSELKRGVEIAAEKNLAGKVESLKMFIEPEEVVNVRPNMETRNNIKKRLERNHDRTRGNRPDRFKQRCSC
jgi:hypothetical protein